MVQERNNKYLAQYMGLLIAVLGGWGFISLATKQLATAPYVRYLNILETIFMTASVILILLYLLYWSISHRLYKGIKYAFSHAKMRRNVRLALLDADYYYSKQYSGEDTVAVLPKVKITFEKDLSRGKLYIKNHLRIQKRLEDKDISSALGKYITEQQYSTDDGNWSVWEFEDSSVNNQLIFNSYNEFVKYSRQFSDYELFMDRKTVVPLASLLLVGATGSGKTYSLYSLILQMLNWEHKPILFFADPKASSLSVLGKKISPEFTAENIEHIIELLELFVSQMEKRKENLQECLETKLDSDYRDFGFEPAIFIIDEFSAFQAFINTMEKKTRDKVAMLLRSVILQGRQLGFFMFICMQKSDSSDIPTAIRDNMIWKCVLSNATRTTYITAFEESADLPKRKFSAGQGLYSYQGITRQPQIVSFPTLNFDIQRVIYKE